jgi:heme exporter protein A
MLYPHLSADDNLRFFGRLYDVADLQGRGEMEGRIDEVLEVVGLTARRTDLVRTFSRGMQQRLTIARAILHRPRVMYFDEPYTGLDQQAASILSEILADVAAAGRTVLMTTHNLERGLVGCDRVVILNRGRVVHDAPRAAIDPASFAEIYNSVTDTHPTPLRSRYSARVARKK